MYPVTWDPETRGIVLLDHTDADEVDGEIRPVFYEELDLLGLAEHWTYPHSLEPLLWAVGRRYYYCGEFVAEAKGGGFFEKPQVLLQRDELNLIPVDVPAMLGRNAALLEGLAFRAVEFIRAEYERRHRQVDIVAVAFSGGKDSFATLDLVQRALSPDEFVVVFSDTSMELETTYRAIDQAKVQWPQLCFYTARSHMLAVDSWHAFGPPSRFQRWCCSVHKSVPSLLLLRKLANNGAADTLVFEGVRRRESTSRSQYPAVCAGGKHISQINARPILEWSAAEVVLYGMGRCLPRNDAYRYGLARVGCTVCPYNSDWGEAISWMHSPEDVTPLLKILAEQYGDARSEASMAEFITTGGWKSRAGGRSLPDASPKVLEHYDGHEVRFLVIRPSENWLEWAKCLGHLAWGGDDRGAIISDGKEYRYSVVKRDSALELIVCDIQKSDPFLYHLRAVINKSAYCVHCRACEAECPTGALSTDHHVQIDQAACIHCFSCLTRIEKGCLVAKSLQFAQTGGSTVKGLDRYCTFGLDSSWLGQYFGDPDSWWQAGKIGPKQYVGMKAWLRDAEVVEGARLSTLGDRLRALGVDHLLTWAVIWANLAENSALIRWYVREIPFGRSYAKAELVARMDGELSERTRQNAATSLIRLFRATPLGVAFGLGRPQNDDSVGSTLLKVGTDQVPPLAVLYSLYRYAAEMDRFALTLSELLSTKCLGPRALFGMSADSLRQTLRGLSTTYGDWIKVEMVRDLDNVYLESAYSAAEVLSLA